MRAHPQKSKKKRWTKEISFTNCIPPLVAPPAALREPRHVDAVAPEVREVC
jgi:hypothetical protein